MNPLDKARTLILSLTSEDDTKDSIAQFDSLEENLRQEQLTELYNTAEAKATSGDTKGISAILRVFEHYGDKSHDRMLLHYIAQAEANNALAVSRGEKSGEFHHEELQTALRLISEAFEDANEINKQTGSS